MLTSVNDQAAQVQARGVRFDGDILLIALSDGREVKLDLNQYEWLRWLARATPEQRAKWSLEPGGFAIYWDDLDDGIEVCHLLSTRPLA